MKKYKILATIVWYIIGSMLAVILLVVLPGKLAGRNIEDVFE